MMIRPRTRPAAIVFAVAVIGTAAPLSAAPMSAAVQPALPAPGGDLVSLYKDLHRHPELSLYETRSAAIMAAEARAAGFTVTEKVGGTGVVAVMVNGKGPVVLIRADMDALPVKEMTGLSYASTAIGKAPDGTDTPVMHACGHDIHMASWVGTARELARRKAEWQGTVVMIGQPAEERGAGAAAMLADGLFTRFPHPDYALALHDDNRMPAGQVSVPQGPALAAGTMINLKVHGIGGHGAYPATTRDPIMLSARIINGLQPLISRENDPFKPGVVTVGSIHAGTKHNIIPDEAVLQLTVRSYDADQQQRLIDGIARVAKGEAIASDIPARLMPEMLIESSTPPTRNTPALAARVEAALIEKFGKDRVPRLDPSMASEDFNAYNLADPRIETTIFWLGAVKQSTWDEARVRGATLPSLHNSGWAPDPAPTIATGVEAMTTAALMLLKKP